MIKGITTIRHARSAKEFEALNALLESLGFERGEPWKGPRSRGQYFLAPVGKLEIYTGRESFPADVWVEVSDLDSIQNLLTKKKTKIVAGIQPTTWGSRVLVAEPADALKIDGEFIRTMCEHPADTAIVEAIVALARNLGMRSIAEWVEDANTLRALKEIGVDYVQGFVIARPQPLSVTPTPF